jgi:hypothetical protein
MLESARSMPKFALAAFLLCLTACSNPEKDQLRKTTVPTYDKTTGRLKQLTFDYDKNGVIDTWTDMDGAKPVFTKQDRNEDGKMDRWEYYTDAKLVKVGFSRRDEGKPDAWAYSGADGKVERVEISFTSDEQKINRWEFYEADALERSEEDSNGDGRPDKWETYKDGGVLTAAFDDDGDGRPNRRFTYDGLTLAFIESEPDAAGNFTKKVAPK